MKKRIISIVLILVMAFSLAVGVCAADADIVVKGFDAKEGETVLVDICLETEIENAINGSFSLKFDPEVLEIVKENGNYNIEGKEVFEGFTMLCAGNNTEGYANYGGTATEGVDLEKGVIYTVEFKVLKEADPKFDFTVESLSLDAPEGQAFESVANDLAVKIEPITLSDGTVVPEPDPEEEDKPESEKEDNIFTGDNMILLPVILVLLVSAFGAFMVYKKKHN